jgi:phosphoribosylglycinamide formyltransferase-1
MTERFVSESIQPVTATYETARMATGEPGLPRAFTWRGRTIEVAAVLHHWRETGKCRHGSPELYVRKHWYEVVTGTHETMKIYFERQARGPRRGERWWLFSIHDSA